jgi:hypothetical protein
MEFYPGTQAPRMKKRVVLIRAGRSHVYLARRAAVFKLGNINHVILRFYGSRQTLCEPRRIEDRVMTIDRERSTSHLAGDHVEGGGAGRPRSRWRSKIGFEVFVLTPDMAPVKSRRRSSPGPRVDKRLRPNRPVRSSTETLTLVLRGARFGCLARGGGTLRPSLGACGLLCCSRALFARPLGGGGSRLFGE